MRTSTNLAFVSTNPARGGGDQRRPREHRTASLRGALRVLLGFLGGTADFRPLTSGFRVPVSRTLKRGSGALGPSNYAPAAGFWRAQGTLRHPLQASVKEPCGG